MSPLSPARRERERPPSLRAWLPRVAWVFTTSQDIDTVVAAVQEGLREGRYAVDSSVEAHDIDRFAVKLGIDSPGEKTGR